MQVVADPVETDPLDMKPFPEIARSIPGARGSKQTNVATLSRWRNPGVRAKDGRRIRLQCTRFPGGWRTSLAMVRAFLAEVTADQSDTRRPAASSSTPARGRASRMLNAI